MLKIIVSYITVRARFSEMIIGGVCVELMKYYAHAGE
ncbi:hypothetical protein SAMN05216278_1770 [Halopelagius longus]|uniref:Uncharacterized protein n=1 Tax=Halopelagius longus TaxID=1236180 RepID=A0A1H1BGT5_9EURY|nr:hypothetical protein SAMN05216278_1770 [Halopelagius longus]